MNYLITDYKCTQSLHPEHFQGWVVQGPPEMDKLKSSIPWYNLKTVDYISQYTKVQYTVL